MELLGADGHFSESPQDQFFLWSAAEEKKVIRRERWKKTEPRFSNDGECWPEIFLRLQNKKVLKICGLQSPGMKRSGAGAGFIYLDSEEMADAQTHGPVFLFLEKLNLEPINFP